jgi:hypothetical protein
MTGTLVWFKLATAAGEGNNNAWKEEEQEEPSIPSLFLWLSIANVFKICNTQILHRNFKCLSVPVTT